MISRVACAAFILIHNASYSIFISVKMILIGSVILLPTTKRELPTNYMASYVPAMVNISSL